VFVAVNIDSRSRTLACSLPPFYLIHRRRSNRLIYAESINYDLALYVTHQQNSCNADRIVYLESSVLRSALVRCTAPVYDNKA